MIEQVYKSLPNQIQNLLVTLYNIKSYRVRYGGAYKKYRSQFKKNDSWDLETLQQNQQQRFLALYLHSIEKSQYYSKIYSVRPSISTIEEIAALPIIAKEEIRANAEDIYCISPEDGVIAKTGGTTGKSLKVLFTADNMQERFAMLDNFRSRFGYRLGKKTAWFSGKDILTPRDIRKLRFWKTDHWYKVRYYSTFHIKKDYMEYYIANLLQFAPEYVIGFPSSIYEIAKFGLSQGQSIPSGIVKAIFPTAETLTHEHRLVIEKFFNAGMYDQYASSEGAPFIFECKNKNLHLELQSGVFEVLDDQNQPTTQGKLVVTSFTSYGTPLIRYDIGDAIELAEGTCGCGNNNPLVKRIMGRIDDYLYSPENGKINLGNVSNTLKDTYGIIKFQAVQKELNSIKIQYLVDLKDYDERSAKAFRKNWTDRFGTKMNLSFEIVDELTVAKSGKFRLIKNEIKHLID